MKIFFVLSSILLISACAHKPKQEPVAPVATPVDQAALEADDDEAVADFGDAPDSGGANQSSLQKFKALSIRPKTDAVAVLKKAGYTRIHVGLDDMRSAKAGDICVSQDKHNRNFAALRLQTGWHSASGRTTEKYPYRDRPKFIGCFRS